jgi:enoyl-CoA hydratase/carnithine racemase
MASDLILSQQGPVVGAQIARPPDNLFTLGMCRELTSVLTEPPAGARVLLLTAAGPNFCLGRARTATTPEDVYTMTGELAALNAAIVTSRLAVIAQVSGDAAGFGVGLAALADVSIAASGSRFWFPEAEAGLSPTLVLTWLPASVGRRLAFWLTATGTAIDAETAEHAGLINQAVPQSRLPGVVEEAVGMLLRQPAAVCPDIKDDLAIFSAPDIRRASGRAVDRLALRSLVLNGRQGR